MAAKINHRPKATATPAKKAAEVRVRGERLASIGSNIVVIRTGNTGNRIFYKKTDGALALVPRAAHALERPGLFRGAVFGQPKSSGVFAYSIYPKDSTKVVRESASGERVVGRLVSGKFKSM